MSNPRFSVLESIDQAFARVSTPEAGAALVGLVLTQALMLVGLQSQLEAQREFIAEEELPLGADGELVPEALPLAVDVPLGLASLLWITMLVGFVAATVVAFRVLVRPEMRMPTAESSTAAPPAWNDRLGRTTFWAIVGAIVGGTLVALGLVAFVVPGLIVATVLAFTHPYLVTERVGLLEAMKRSFDLTRGSWLRVFALLVVTALSFLTISSLGTLAFVALESAPAAAELANVGFGSLAWLFTLALLASGFDQLEAQRSVEAEKWEGIDDELLP